jgi:hypothetical protein
MALIIENKLLFVHIRKTGGSFIRAYCNETALHTSSFGKPQEWNKTQHYSIDQLIELEPSCSGLTSFAFVRDPIQWIRSYWSWARKSNYLSKKDTIEAAKNHWLYDCMDTDFNIFMEKYLDKHKGKASEFMLNPLGYLYIRESNMLLGEQKVTHVLRYEQLLQELHKLFTHHGIKINSDKLFTTPRRREASNSIYKQQCNMPMSLAHEFMKAEKHIYNLYYNIEY